MNVDLKKQRASTSDVSVSIDGMLGFNVQVDFITVKEADNSTKFKVICPSCDDAMALSQRYICPDHDAAPLVRQALAGVTKASEVRDAVETALAEVHGPYTAAEADRAREISKMLHRVTASEIAEVKQGDLPEKDLTLYIVPRAEVTGQTIPDGTVHRIRPVNTNKATLEGYALLQFMATQPDYALIGEVNTRGTQRMVMLDTVTDAEGHTQLCVRELDRPGDVKEFDIIEVDLSEKHLTMATTFMENVAVPFDPEQFKNRVKDRAAALDAAKSGGEGTAVAATARPTPVDDGNDLAALFEASLAAVNAKKKAKRAS